MKSKNISTALLVVILVAGLCLLLYPSFSNFWNSLHATKAIADYDEVIMEMEEEDFSEAWSSAVEFNGLLNGRNDIYRLTDKMLARYNTELDVTGSGIMTHINIPKLNVNLPVYHGSDEAVLQVAIGHLEWSSLPVGGESTHCVVSGHRGLPSAKLFTELDKLEIGDTFTLKTLGETLTYEVDQILVVEPHEMDALKVVEGEDLCTLVTCTPYGINSHRLFVRGHRTDNAPVVVERRVVADAVLVDSTVVAGALLMPCMLLAVIGIFAFNGIGDSIHNHNKRKKERKGGAA